MQRRDVGSFAILDLQITMVGCSLQLISLYQEASFWFRKHMSAGSLGNMHRKRQKGRLRILSNWKPRSTLAVFGQGKQNMGIAPRPGVWRVIAECLGGPCKILELKASFWVALLSIETGLEYGARFFPSSAVQEALELELEKGRRDEREHRKEEFVVGRAWSCRNIFPSRCHRCLVNIIICLILFASSSSRLQDSLKSHAGQSRRSEGINHWRLKQKSAKKRGKHIFWRFLKKTSLDKRIHQKAM